MARPRDAADAACEEWAEVMRDLVGWTQPKLARDYLGSLRCTLAARRDLHHGGRSERRDQHWPEFPFANRGQAAAVNEVYKRLNESLQEIMVAHWIVTTPRSKSIRADLLGISTREYWQRVARAKCAIHGALAIVESVRTL